MTGEYKRQGTTTLFRSPPQRAGTVPGQCHRIAEFIRFLRLVALQTPAEFD
jgi:hypothetical protein